MQCSWFYVILYADASVRSDRLVTEVSLPSGSYGRKAVQVQVLLSAPNKNKTNRIISVRFFISLVCNRTCDNAVHCLHTLCAPARCAADASLPRINSPVPLLRSLRSLQVLLSAPPKSLENSVFSRLLLFIFRCHTAVGGFTA